MANPSKPQSPITSQTGQKQGQTRPAQQAPGQPKAQQGQSPSQMSHGQGQVKNPDNDKRLKENRE